MEQMRRPRRTQPRSVRAFRASDAEWRLIDAAAAEDWLPTGTWIRETLLREARERLRLTEDT